MTKIKEKTKKDIDALIQQSFNLKNIMEAPSIREVIINVGIGNFVAQKAGKEQKKVCEQIMADLFSIVDQKPLIIKSNKSIANFKLKKGTPAGMKLTLRKKPALNFLYRLINVALPRVRDFKGISSKFISDEGILNLGIKEQTIFPEIVFDNVTINFGFQVTIVLKNIKNKNQAIEFYKLLGFPIKID